MLFSTTKAERRLPPTFNLDQFAASLAEIARNKGYHFDEIHFENDFSRNFSRRVTMTQATELESRPTDRYYLLTRPLSKTSYFVALNRWGGVIFEDNDWQDDLESARVKAVPSTTAPDNLSLVRNDHGLPGIYYHREISKDGATAQLSLTDGDPFMSDFLSFLDTRNSPKSGVAS